MSDPGEKRERLQAELARLRQKLAELEAAESSRQPAAVSERGNTDAVGLALTDAELGRLNAEVQQERLRVFRATMRTVQEIVNNLLNSLQLVHLEAEGHVPAEVLTLVGGAIQEAAVKLKALGDLETITEREMALGQGIDYPGAGT